MAEKKTLKVLRDEYAEKQETMLTIARKVSEGEELSEDETKLFNDGEEELTTMKRGIETAEKAQAMLAAAGMPVTMDTKETSDKDNKEAKHFSMRRAALVAGVESNAFSADEVKEDLGFEREQSQEFMNEAKANKVVLRAGAQAGIPTRIARMVAANAYAAQGLGSMSRALSVTGDSATKGGATVDNILDTDIVRLFRKAQAWRGLGARIKTGLSSDYTVIDEGSYLAADWEGEVDALALTDKTFSTRTLGPKRLAAGTVRSRQLIIQASPDIDNELTSDLFWATDDALDTAVWTGAGTGNVPKGIMAETAIPVIDLGADANTGVTLGTADGGGAVDTRKMLLNMIKAVSQDDALAENMAWASNDDIRFNLMNLKLDAGSGKFLMESMDRLMNYPFIMTNKIPNDIVKGTSDAIHSAIILANFKELEVSGWGGLSLIVNPYSLDTTSQVRITMDSFWNILWRRGKAGRIVKDIVAA